MKRDSDLHDKILCKWIIIGRWIVYYDAKKCYTNYYKHKNVFIFEIIKKYTCKID